MMGGGNFGFWDFFLKYVGCVVEVLFLVRVSNWQNLGFE